MLTKLAYFHILSELKHLKEWNTLKNQPVLLLSLAYMNEQAFQKVTAEDLESLPDTYKVLGTYVNNRYLVVNPHTAAVDLPKAENYSDYEGTMDVAPFDPVRNAPTDKEQQWNPKRRKLDRSDRDNFFERGLHETVNVPQTERSVTPFGSLQTFAWDLGKFNHEGFIRLREILAGPKKLNKTVRKIANNTYLRVEDEGTPNVYFALKLHRTDVVTYYADRIELFTGGWNTVTTRDRMNFGLGLVDVPGGVSTHRGVIYFMKQGDWDTRYPFEGSTYNHESIAIRWDGTPIDVEPIFIKRRPRKVVPDEQEQIDFRENVQQPEQTDENTLASQNQGRAQSLESFSFEEVSKDSQSTGVVYPTPEQIIEMHDDIIERMGQALSGTTPDTIKKLEAAIGRMQSGYGAMDLYPSLIEKAAVLMESIIKSHAFIDANKRTATMAGVLFLMFNGEEMEDSDEFASVMEHVADSSLTHDALVEWLQKHVGSGTGSRLAAESTDPNTAIIYPTAEDIVDAHEYVLNQFGGKQGEFPETISKLQAAIGRMQSSAFGQELFATIVEKAAVIIHSIVTAHPFPDGNKRTAYLAAMEFLYENDLYVKDTTKVVGAVHLMAENEGNYDMLMDALRDNVFPVRDTHHRNLQNLSWDLGVRKVLKSALESPIYTT